MIDRTCPETSPLRPEYAHYYLSPTEWPSPESAAATHFWMSRPLPGAGRLLITEWLPYGYDAGGRYLLHNGVDMAEPLGTPLLAVADGTVVYAGADSSRLYGWRCDWYGNLVVIELSDRWQDQAVYALYGHVLEIQVEPGQQVKRGDQVAEIGVGGAATLPHLHFEVRVGTNEFSSSRNPLLWLAPPSTRGIIAGRLIDPEGRPWHGVAIHAIGQSDDAESRTTWTYLDDPLHVINPDEGLAENFVFADLIPGRYEIYIELQAVIYRAMVDVNGGQLSTVEIVTENYRTPTPAPAMTAEITTTPSE